MLNIAGIGILAYELEQNVNVGVVVGIKSAHWWAPSFISVEKAVEAGKLANVPVMVDFGYFLKERPYQTMVTDILRRHEYALLSLAGAAPRRQARGVPAPGPALTSGLRASSSLLAARRVHGDS